MKKKILSFLLVGAMVLGLAACGNSNNSTSKSGSGTSQDGGNTSANSDLKVGVILLGDETEGYSKAHMDGISAAIDELGLSKDNLIWKYKVPEDSSCYEAAVDLVDSGCGLIISNSYGHQTYMVQAAQEFPDTDFISMTGDFAAISGCDNFSNAFTSIYEARYVSGVVAGLKLKEMVESGELSAATQANSFDADGNIKIGYVGAFNYAEVVSGYTSFYLGVKSVMPNVVMEVKYTNSWFDIDKEGAAAEALIANGCVIIGQHADSTGAPAATQKLKDTGKICYSIGYNIDMLDTAPTAALTSATNTWGAFYKEAIGAAMKGETVPADWAKGFADNAVGITKLGESCAAGTEEYVKDVESKIADGSLKIFDTSTFTVEGKEVTTAEVDLSYYDYSTGTPQMIYEGKTEEAIKDGAFQESTLRSAPYFALRIDGITEDTTE